MSTTTKITFSDVKASEKRYIDKFKKTSLAERKVMSANLRKHRPNLIPVIVDRLPSCTKGISKHKFLVPRDNVAGSFIYGLRLRIRLEPAIALFWFVDESNLITLTRTMSEIYETHKNVDGFLYVTYSLEETFG